MSWFLIKLVLNASYRTKYIEFHFTQSAGNHHLKLKLNEEALSYNNETFCKIILRTLRPRQ